MADEDRTMAMKEDTKAQTANSEATSDGTVAPVAISTESLGDAVETGAKVEPMPMMLWAPLLSAPDAVAAAKEDEEQARIWVPMSKEDGVKTSTPGRDWSMAWRIESERREDLSRMSKMSSSAAKGSFEASPLTSLSQGGTTDDDEIDDGILLADVSASTSAGASANTSTGASADVSEEKEKVERESKWWLQVEEDEKEESIIRLMTQAKAVASTASELAAMAKELSTASAELAKLAKALESAAKVTADAAK